MMRRLPWWNLTWVALAVTACLFAAACTIQSAVLDDWRARCLA